jgi:hypothetical protein
MNKLNEETVRVSSMSGWIIKHHWIWCKALRSRSSCSLVAGLVLHSRVVCFVLVCVYVHVRFNLPTTDWFRNNYCCFTTIDDVQIVRACSFIYFFPIVLDGLQLAMRSLTWSFKLFIWSKKWSRMVFVIATFDTKGSVTLMCCWLAREWYVTMVYLAFLCLTTLAIIWSHW